jgi:hypothetical protein
MTSSSFQHPGSRNLRNALSLLAALATLALILSLELSH